ncbi:MAG: alpha amylase C-terminal domain-containing protein [Planctomycetes bacterium]|nr:alpha amylase C-terminal domain-containing protein [Planctomycetota bacterium]
MGDKRSTGISIALPFLLAVLTASSLAPAASNDNNVEWNGVFSHPTFRSPQFPGKNQSFTVELRVFKGDITGARVRTWDGSERFHAMAWSRNEGIYDVWRGTISGTSTDYLYYYFEVTDGSDADYYNALGMWGSAPPRGDFLIITTGLGTHPLGATPVAGGTAFRVWAPNTTSASVAGTFNGWNGTQHRMTGVQGFWEVLVPGAAAGHEYKFVLDGGTWRTDPRARRQTSSVGNSVVVKPDGYAWGDAGWVTPYFEDMVVYELHVGSFSGDGDGVAHYPGRYRDVADVHLDHLAELGINVIELMPLGEFAGDRSWGYNPAFQYAPESAYGRPEDLKYLVDKAHQRGIAVVLDVVYNHMGPSDLAGNILEYDGEEIYFYPTGNGYRETPWGPRLDYGRVEVRDFIRENVVYWLRELHLDGLRVDATDFIKVNGDGWQVLKDIAQAADTVSSKAIVIAEQLPNDPAVSRPIAEGGAGLDAQWNDAFHDSLRSAIGAAAFGDPDMTAVAAGVNHFEIPGAVVNYIESHDEAAHQGRVAKIADPADPESEWAYGRAKVAAGLVVFSAGIPMLLQGQELLESRNFGDGTEDRIRWRYATEHADFLQFVKDVLHLRRTQPALRSSAGQNVYHVNDLAGANVIAIHRWAGAGDDLVAVMTFANGDLTDYDLGLPLPGEWLEVLNGDAAVYGGRNHGNSGKIVAGGPPRHGFGQSARILIPRMGVLVFARKPASLAPRRGFLRADGDRSGSVDLTDAVHALRVLFKGAAIGSCPAAYDANADGTFDVSDAVFTVLHLFGGGRPPQAPWPDCGPNPGSLACEADCGG